MSGKPIRYNSGELMVYSLGLNGRVTGFAVAIGACVNRATVGASFLYVWGGGL